MCVQNYGEKPFCVTLTAIAVIVATILSLPPAQAATSPHFALVDGEPFHRIRVDLDSPSLVVRLHADGSLDVSKSDGAEGNAITLPSLQALPVEIETLVPRREERHKLAVMAVPTLPWRNFVTLMNKAKDAGFGKVSIMGLEKKELHGGPSELVVRLYDSRYDPSNKALFVSLGNDEIVTLSLGLGPNAKAMLVNLAAGSEAAGSLVPKSRAKKEVYFRADVEVPLGNALDLLGELRAIGFTNVDIVGEATN